MQDGDVPDQAHPEARHHALGAFLADRRLRPTLGPTPDELLRRPFRRKAHAGLRSAEVAYRAGIDPGYYAKIEQGRATSPSIDVLNSLARALELTEAEGQHLFDLARRGRPTPSETPEPECMPAGGRELLDGLMSTPAYIIDRAYDLLGWNDGISAVFGDPCQLPPGRRNVVWMMFAIPEMQEAIEDWAGHAQRLMAQFRLDWGQARGDARFESLIAELLDVSPDFRSWWPRYDVQGRQELTKRVLPPAFERAIEFAQMTWALSTASGIRFVSYSPTSPGDLAAATDCIRQYQAAHAQGAA